MRIFTDMTDFVAAPRPLLRVAGHVDACVISQDVRCVESDALSDIVNEAAAAGAYPWIQIDGGVLAKDTLTVMRSLNRLASVNAFLAVLRPMDESDDLWMPSALDHVMAAVGWSLAEPAAPVPWISGPHRLFHRCNAAPRYQLSVPQVADVPDCRALFERAFGHAVDPLLWEWKYGGGRGVSVIARRSERLLAHYGCVSREIRFRGQAARAVQICDVMVDPDERGLMTKTGAFYQVATASQDTIIGLDGRYLLGFGFPNDRHMILGRRSGLYAEVERLVELRWPSVPHSRAWSTTARSVSITACSDQIRVLWERMANDLTDHVVGVRDPGYLAYRYESHPGWAYESFLVRRRWGKPLGLLVLRCDGEVCRLIDVVGPMAHLPVLVRFAQGLSAAMGMKSLLFWVTSSQVPRFESTQPAMVPLDIRIPANQYRQRVAPADVQHRWWLVMGDTDFM